MLLQPYDIREVIDQVIDGGSFLEVHKDFAENIVVGFARLAGRSIGIVANQPAFLAGVLDINSSTKQPVLFAFAIALISRYWYLKMYRAFYRAPIRNGTPLSPTARKLLYAFCEATVPRITVITRKAYGGAYDVMNSKHIGADMNYAWPSAEIAVMGAKGCCRNYF